MNQPIDDVLDDLRAEYSAIESLLASLSDDQWVAPSMADGWTVADTVLHLAITEEGVVTTLGHEQLEWTTRDRPLDDVVDDQVHSVSATPTEIFERWRAAQRAALAGLASADPSVHVRWAAAPLRPRTLATTRLAEHWAHTLDVAEALGLAYPDTDRLRHIAWLGHATLPYAFGLERLDPVDVRCTLIAPSGATHVYGPDQAATTITGSMGAFCRVGARRLVGSESGLVAVGPGADDVLRLLRNYAA